jgi:hypothetical protein
MTTVIEGRILPYLLEFHRNTLPRRVLVDPSAQRQADTILDPVDELSVSLDRILEIDVHHLEYLTTTVTSP